MFNDFTTTLKSFLRSNFLAGLFVAVPFAISIWFLYWVWGMVNKPLAGVFNVASGPDDTPWAQFVSGFQSSSYGKILVPVLGLLLVFFAVLILGIITRSIIGRMALAAIEAAVARLPLIGVLYSSVKQLGEAFISTDGKSKFQRAVAVQFPHKGCWAVGFVTGNADLILRNVTQLPPEAMGNPERLLTVFVPTTPLPSNGFMIVVPEAETFDLKMSVQDALKLVVSGGMIGPSEVTPANAGKLTRLMIATPASTPKSKGM